eukprot:SAG31_NODE_33933_length_338_cov_1.092050_1_plen_20_part_01
MSRLVLRHTADGLQVPGKYG